MNGNIATYLDNFGVEHIQSINQKNYWPTKYHNKYLQNIGYDSIMCGYFCTGFIDLMFKG